MKGRFCAFILGASLICSAILISPAAGADQGVSVIPKTTAANSPSSPKASGDGTSASNKLVDSDDSLENHSLVSSNSTDSLTDSKTTNAQPSFGSMDTFRVVLVLIGVVGLILLLRSVVRYFFPGVMPSRSSGTMKVVSRFTIAPRQHLLLVQVGRRLLVVGDSGAQLNSLCEIRNPDEVAAILGQIQEETINASRPFDMFFGKARKGFDDLSGSDLNERPSEDSEMDSTETIEEKFDDSRDIPDPALAATRKEISGLSERVRDLVKQISKS